MGETENRNNKCQNDKSMSKKDVIINLRRAHGAYYTFGYDLDRFPDDVMAALSIAIKELEKPTLKMPKRCIDCYYICQWDTLCNLTNHDVEDAILRQEVYGGCPIYKFLEVAE